MVEASRCLALSEAGARKKMKASQVNHHSRFPVGIEWEILNADAVVLLGLTHALRYALNVSRRIIDPLPPRVVNHIWDIFSACTFFLNYDVT